MSITVMLNVQGRLTLLGLSLLSPYFDSKVVDGTMGWSGGDFL